MDTDVGAETALVVTVKVATFEPAGTVTLAGTRATVWLLLVSVMRAPPAGAEAVSDNCPCAVFPPSRAVGLMKNEASPRPALKVRTSDQSLRFPERSAV